MKLRYHILSTFLSIIIFIGILVDIVTIGLSLGLFKESNLYSALDKSQVYESIYDDFFASNSLSEQENQYLKEAISIDTVKTVVDGIIHYVFTSEMGDFDLTSQISEVLNNYADIATNNVTIYVNDYFDVLKKNNYIFSKDIILNSPEEDYCVSTMGFNLNDYVAEMYAVCNNDSAIFATIADTIKNEALTSINSAISSELLASNDKLSEYVNSTFLNELFKDESSDEFDTLRELTNIIIQFNKHVGFIIAVATIIVVLSILIMYFAFRPTHTHLVFRNIAIILLLLTIELSITIKGINLVKASLLAELNGNFYTFISTLSSLYIKPFTFLTVCIAVIMVFCFILYYILKKVYIRSTKRNY